MLHETISVSSQTNAVLKTYILSKSDQIQVNARKPAVIVCPGGAYLRISDQEAEQVALHFNAIGFHAAVLHYSCGAAALMPNPLVELGTAMNILRKNAELWGIAKDRIAICGFSAGGHLCALFSTKYQEVADMLSLDSETIQPNAVILGYPCIDLGIHQAPLPLSALLGDVDESVAPETLLPEPFHRAICCIDGKAKINLQGSMLECLFGTSDPSIELLKEYSPHHHVSGQNAPCFVWTTANDDLLPSIHSMRFTEALLRQSIPVELHMYMDGKHGLSIADETTANDHGMVNTEVSSWFGLLRTWLRKLWPISFEEMA